MLFRYLGKIKGIATVGKEAVPLPEPSGDVTYEGFIILQDIHVLPHPLMIEELEEITGVPFHQRGRSFDTGDRVYQKVPVPKIRIVVDRLNEILGQGAHRNG